MKSEIILTDDGSHSLYVPELNVSYHSRHGAIQESMHIFIQSGLSTLLNRKKISVFEMGFGTGLNALLTFISAEKKETHIYYETVEKFPLPPAQAASLNYLSALGRPDLQEAFVQMHNQLWNIKKPLSNNFILYKRKEDITEMELPSGFDIIYFDAFDPLTQPSLWSTTVFKKLYNSLSEGGSLVTYCSKTIVRHAMTEAGFTVNKIPGPKGKREIVRAVKQSV